MKNYNEKSDKHIVGVLASQVDVDPYGNKKSLFIKDGVLNFMVKPISQQPKNFFEARIFNVKLNDIGNLGFSDNTNLSFEKRIVKLEKFLSELLLIFKPYKKDGNYYIYDVSKVNKPQGYLETHRFLPISLINVDELYASKKEFYKDIICKNLLKKIDNDIFSSVIAFKSNNNIKIIGEFVNKDGNLNYNFLKVLSLNDYWKSNIVEIEDTLFVESATLTSIENEIESGFDINVEGD